ncbi:AAA family ATPase [Aquifex sp.]
MKIIKHLSVRLTWHDSGWNGESCKDPENNLSCQQDSNVFIHETKVIHNGRCHTDTSKARTYINKYLRNNKCFLKHSKLGFLCKIHTSRFLSTEESSVDIPPCDGFAAFKAKNPFVHTKNPARKLDEYDNAAVEECILKKGKKPRDEIKNWYQVKHSPQDYRRHIVEGRSIALFYTVNLPEETGKFIVGFSVIKKKNNDFLTSGSGQTTIPNKSNSGKRWGEEWCFLLDEDDRYRFPFQELIETRNFDLLEQAKELLRVEPQDERFFRNLSLFIPDNILLKYLRKLRQAVYLLEFGGFDVYVDKDLSRIDAKIQELTKSYLSFRYPGLPAVGRFLQWWKAFSDYEECLDHEDLLKENLFRAVYKGEYAFKLKDKIFYIGSRKRNSHPKNEISENFIKLLEEILVYYPFSNEKVLERLRLLIDKNILRVEDIVKNPYILLEEFIHSQDGEIDISFEDIDYGEYKRRVENLRGDEEDKEDILQSFFLNPYRIRALIHEYFKVYRDDPGFVWISFKDIENYIRSRLSSGLGTAGFELNFEEILKSKEIQETIDIDWNKKFLTLKKLSNIEKNVQKAIRCLIESSNFPKISEEAVEYSIRQVFDESFIENISEEEIEEKKQAILKILSNKFTFISGVAGSGKSTIIKILIEILESLGESYKILTPTGKASERLRTYGMESDTIHYFLKENGFIDNEIFVFREDGEKQVIDNLIIDEISMVPLDTLYYLLKAVDLNKLKRLIFVGDIKQLPPIGYGYPAKDIYRFLEQNYPQNLVKLEKSYRSQYQFVNLANKLREENLSPQDLEPYFTDTINDRNFQILKFSGQGELEGILNKIIQNENVTKEKLAQDPETFQILAPKKEGYSGTNHLNRFISDLLNEQKYNKGSDLLNKEKFSWKYTKLIKLVNTYCPPEKEHCVETFNGMIGSVIWENGWKVIFGADKKIPFSPEKLGYEYDYAYAITVHKSQGSEFDTVVVVLPENIGNLFTRELLYTALTRPRERLYLLVENENILYKTPLEIERSGKLFGENLLELPDNTAYTSLNGAKVSSKLDLYVAALLDLNNIRYLYRTATADFETTDKRIHIIDLNTFQGRIKNQKINEDEKNIKLSYENEINIKDFLEKLSIKYREKSGGAFFFKADTNFKVISHNGLVTRSISEALLMLLFDHLGLKYEYERKLNVKNGESLLPDFYFPELDVYWEHLGLLSDPYYLERWKEKKRIYEEMGITVLSLEEWRGERKCCIYTTEEDIKNLKNLYEKLKGKFIAGQE